MLEAEVHDLGVCGYVVGQHVQKLVSSFHFVVEGALMMVSL